MAGAPGLWVAERLEVICALTGEFIVEIKTERKSVADLHEEVSTALGSSFIIRLVDGIQDVAKMATAGIRSPLKLVKLRKKNPHRYGLHRILLQMNSMEGSANAGIFVAMVDNDPNKMSQLASIVYKQWFAETSEGYILQARMMLLHSMMTSYLEPPPEEVVLQRLSKVRRDDAIAELIKMHNEGDIELCHTRFQPLANSLRIRLRRGPVDMSS